MWLNLPDAIGDRRSFPGRAWKMLTGGVVLLLFTIAGCGGESFDPAILEEYPLSPGARWTYSLADTEWAGSTVIRTSADTVRVAFGRAAEVSGLGDVYEITIRYGSRDALLFYAKLSGSQITFHYSSDPPTPTGADAFTPLRFPLAVGRTWPYFDEYGLDSIRVVGQRTVSAGGRDYPDAFQLRRNWFSPNNPGTDDFWFVRGIGFVGLDRWSVCTVCGSDLFVRHLRLIEYHFPDRNKSENSARGRYPW